jgi:hypothetical protein
MPMMPMRMGITPSIRSANFEKRKKKTRTTECSNAAYRIREGMEGEGKEGKGKGEERREEEMR